MKKILCFVAVAALVFGATSCKPKADNAQPEAEATEVKDEAKPAVEEFVLTPFNTIDELAASDSSVVVLPSGLAYKVIAEGVGEKPTKDNTATVIYTGYHTDGSTFDSSNGNPVSFPLSGVIPGFSEGIGLMTPGSHYVLYIPGNLGYGANGIPGVIAPNETLVFDVQLVDFQ